MECTATLSGCQQIEDNIFIVSIQTKTGKKFTIDMVVGLSECKIGVSVSLWLHPDVL